MVDTCDYIGIHPYEIEKASEVVEGVCKERSLDSDKIWDSVLQEFGMRYGENFGNKVILMMFESLAYALRDKGIADDRLSWYVNGLDSHFIIDGEEI